MAACWPKTGPTWNMSSTSCSSPGHTQLALKAQILRFAWMKRGVFPPKLQSDSRRSVKGSQARVLAHLRPIHLIFNFCTALQHCQVAMCSHRPTVMSGQRRRIRQLPPAPHTPPSVPFAAPAITLGTFSSHRPTRWRDCTAWHGICNLSREQVWNLVCRCQAKCSSSACRSCGLLTTSAGNVGKLP